MSTVEKISVALTPELANEVKSAVKHGDYASSSEVIREALRDWREKRVMKTTVIEEIREAWNQGLSSGAGQYDSMDAIKAAARKR